MCFYINLQLSSFRSLAKQQLNTVSKFYIFILLCLISNVSFGQKQNIDSTKVYIQFSGKVVTQDDGGDVVALPYVSIGILGTSRGTYSEVDGFFSMVAAQGDTIRFTRVGYADATIAVPDTLGSLYYSWIQIMSQDSILLPEAVIYPWPDRDFYKIEFLALDISDELMSNARENIAEKVMKELRYSVPADGTEAYNYEFRKRVNEYKYEGQYKPQNIFSPIAWAQFIKAWKRGDFKKKKKDDN